MTEFDNLRTLHAATTPGEWEANYTLVTTDGAEYPNDVVASTTENESWERNRADAAFIVAAHNELPALLARLDEVTAERDALAAIVSAERTATAALPVAPEQPTQANEEYAQLIAEVREYEDAMGGEHENWIRLVDLASRLAAALLPRDALGFPTQDGATFTAATIHNATERHTFRRVVHGKFEVRGAMGLIVSARQIDHTSIEDVRPAEVTK